MQKKIHFFRIFMDLKIIRILNIQKNNKVVEKIQKCVLIKVFLIAHKYKLQNFKQFTNRITKIKEF